MGPVGSVLGLISGFLGFLRFLGCPRAGGLVNIPL
jgi:hypothetical protein